MKKTLFCLMIAMALSCLLTLGSQAVADEAEGEIPVNDCEVYRQTPAAICVTVEDTGGPAEEISE